MQIDYSLLAKAKEYYEKEGFNYIETPWLVSSAASNITAPEGVLHYIVTKGQKTKEFVASGEQGFLYLALKGYLTPGKYCTITPCLRNDDFDYTHSKQFMKCELIEFLAKPIDPVDYRRYMNDVMSYAEEFFLSQGLKTNEVKVSETSSDLYSENDVELGSYGYRSFEGLHWIYGTGLAEPRFSRVKNVLSS